MNKEYVDFWAGFACVPILMLLPLVFGLLATGHSYIAICFTVLMACLMVSELYCQHLSFKYLENMLGFPEILPGAITFERPVDYRGG